MGRKKLGSAPTSRKVGADPSLAPSYVLNYGSVTAAYAFSFKIVISTRRFWLFGPRVFETGLK